MSSIYEFVRKQRDDYCSQSIEIAEGYHFSQYDTLRTIKLYHNSRFETGNKDTLGREKPFYSICKFRVNVAVRATDIDTKDVDVESARSEDYAQSFMLNLKNRNWMRDSNFAGFLNRFGGTRAKYGGVLVKKTEKDSELCLHVLPWRNMVTDQVDIRGGVKIERHYYTPAELKTFAPKNWMNIDKAVTTAKKSQEAVAANHPSNKNRTPGSYIEVYESTASCPTATSPRG